MSSHSDSPLSSLCATPTWTHAKNSDTRNIIPGHQKKRVKIWAQCGSCRPVINATTIDMLTDNVLLEIFNLIRGPRSDFENLHVPVWTWHPLVHVCYRWRQIIFASPLRLDLQLLCTYGTPVKDLGCWPAFPIVIDYNCWRSFTPDSEDNVVAALEHPSRVRQVKLTVTDSLWRKMVTVMQEPFPSLTLLSISSIMDWDMYIFPGEFFGGSAPCLREIRFSNIPIPALPTLLSSASDLVKLDLLDIPQIGYISPAALAACLAVLPKLDDLSIGFQWRASRVVDHIHLPPETRVVFPALTSFLFAGEIVYLEDFVARINTPRLNSIDITYSNQLDSEPRVPQLSDFINRSDLKLSRFKHAGIYFDHREITFCFCQEVDASPDEFAITIRISSLDGTRIDEEVWDMAQVLRHTSAMLSDVVHLEIKAESNWRLEEGDAMNEIEWLELLRPFTAVETLRVSEEFAESAARAFGDMNVEMATQVLPALDYLCLQDQPTRTIDKLFTTLRGCGRSLTIVGDEGLNSEGSESENDPYRLRPLY